MNTHKVMQALPGREIRELFDPVQTHAVYKVADYEVDDIKATLKARLKATRFRIVKSGIKGLVIVCFKVKGA